MLLRGFLDPAFHVALLRMNLLHLLLQRGDGNASMVTLVPLGVGAFLAAVCHGSWMVPPSLLGPLRPPALLFPGPGRAGATAMTISPCCVLITSVGGGSTAWICHTAPGAYGLDPIGWIGLACHLISLSTLTMALRWVP